MCYEMYRSRAASRAHSQDAKPAQQREQQPVVEQITEKPLPAKVEKELETA